MLQGSNYKHKGIAKVSSGDNVNGVVKVIYLSLPYTPVKE